MLLQDLNIGDKIKIGNYSAYVAQNTMLLDAKRNTICDSNHCILIVPIKNVRGFIQDKQKVKNMCSNYEYSLIRQWLNSDSTGKWFTKSYPKQEPVYDNKGGFLSELPKPLLKKMDNLPCISYKPTVGLTYQYTSSDKVTITSEEEMCSPSVGEPEQRLEYFKKYTLKDLLEVESVATRTLKDEDTYVEVNADMGTSYSFCYSVHDYIAMLYVKKDLNVVKITNGYSVNELNIRSVPITVEENKIYYKFITDNLYKYTVYINDQKFVTNDSPETDTRYYVTFEQLNEYWKDHYRLEFKVVGELIENPSLKATAKLILIRTTSNIDKAKKVVINNKIYDIKLCKIDGMDKYKITLSDTPTGLNPTDKATLFSGNLKLRYTEEHKGSLIGCFGDKVSEVAKDNAITYKYSNKLEHPTDKISYTLSADECSNKNANIRSISIAFNYHSDKE